MMSHSSFIEPSKNTSHDANNSNASFLLPDDHDLSSSSVIMSPVSSRYTFGQQQQSDSTSSFFQNDWASPINFSVGNGSTNTVLDNSLLSGATSVAATANPGHTSSNSNTSTAPTASAVAPKNGTATSSFSHSTVPITSKVSTLKHYLSQSSLEEKKILIDEFIDFFLFDDQHHSSDLFAYLKLKIDRFSFNDDLDSPNNINPVNINNNSFQNTAAAVNNKKMFIHNKANSIHSMSSSSNENNINTSIINAPPTNNNKDQVFSPLLAESGFLQNQALRYQKNYNPSGYTNNNFGNFHHNKSASLSINTSIASPHNASNAPLTSGAISSASTITGNIPSAMTITQTNPNNGVSVLSNNANVKGSSSSTTGASNNQDLLSNRLVSTPTRTSFANKRAGNLSLSINTSSAGNNTNISSNMHSPIIQTHSANIGNNNSHNTSNLNSPSSPGGPNANNNNNNFNLDPSTRLKLQALSTINSRSKLDALKKVPYSPTTTTSTPNELNNNNINGGMSNHSNNNGNNVGNSSNMPNTPISSSNVSKPYNKSSNPTTPIRTKNMENQPAFNKDDLALKSLKLAQALKSLQLNDIKNNHSSNGSSTGNSSNGRSLLTPINTSAAILGSLNGNNGNLMQSPKSPSLNAMELTDLKTLQDLPVWLKNLRLHKYTKILEVYNWKELIYFDDNKLESVGVSAMGARRKLLKAFDIVKVAYENGNIREH